MSLFYTIVVSDNGELKNITSQQLQAAGFLYDDMLRRAMETALDQQAGFTRPVSAAPIDAAEKLKTVHVVMGNDYPKAVFDTEAEAEAYCTLKKRAEDEMKDEMTGTVFSRERRVFWRHYDFELNKG